MGVFIFLGLAAYALLAKFIVCAIGKHTRSKAAKYVAIGVFVLIPTWDIVPGYLYFSYLCEKEAGAKVLKTVEVEEEYFLPDGRPDESKLSDRFAQSHRFYREFSTLFHIMRFESTIKDKQSSEVLGSATSLSHFGGWLVAYLFPLGNATTCPERVHTAIWSEVIKHRKIMQ